MRKDNFDFGWISTFSRPVWPTTGATVCILLHIAALDQTIIRQLWEWPVKVWTVEQCFDAGTFVSHTLNWSWNIIGKTRGSISLFGRQEGYTLTDLLWWGPVNASLFLKQAGFVMHRQRYLAPKSGGQCWKHKELILKSIKIKVTRAFDAPLKRTISLKKAKFWFGEKVKASNIHGMSCYKSSQRTTLHIQNSVGAVARKRLT